ncbi:unnamed protein product [Brassica oleracea]
MVPHVHHVSTDHVDPEMVGYYYQCDTWGLKRPLGSFIKSFLNDKNLNHKYVQVSAVAYSDVGWILIYAMSKIMEKSSLYVANPVSHECVEIFIDPLPKGVERSQFCFWQWGIATRVENGILLGYTVVVFNQKWSDTKLSCLIYSSETGLWSLDTSFSNYYYCQNSISLNGNLHWLARNNDYQEVVLSMDFYTNSTGSDRCRVSPFPDLGRTTKFKRSCTPCHGFLMYMNIVYATKSVICNWFQLTSGGRTMIPAHDPRAIISLKNAYTEQVDLIPFVLPQWLYRIPNTCKAKLH